MRKEFLYRKSLEGKEKERYEKKRKIQKAMAGIIFFFFFWAVKIENPIKLFSEGTAVPTELRDEADDLVREIKLDGVPDTAPMDDEYQLTLHLLLYFVDFTKICKSRNSRSKSIHNYK